MLCCRNTAPDSLAPDPCPLRTSSILAIMSDRERWIIYPLLFLALGSSIWGKLNKQIYSPLVRCHELEVIGPDDAVKIQLSASPRRPAGEIRLFGSDSKHPLAIIHGDPTGKFGVVECRDAEGRLVAAMQGTGFGNGRVEVHDHEQSWAVSLSHEGLQSGLSISDLRTGRSAFLLGASVARGQSPTLKPPKEEPSAKPLPESETESND